MPNTVVTIEIAEGDVAAVVKALTKRAGLEDINANGKPALVKIVKGWVIEERREEEAARPPTIT